MEKQLKQEVIDLSNEIQSRKIVIRLKKVNDNYKIERKTIIDGITVNGSQTMRKQYSTALFNYQIKISNYSLIQNKSLLN